MAMICVYCGSATGASDKYSEAAAALGDAIADAGHGLVFGGSRNGLMGIIADRILERGFDAVGVLPRDLMHKEVGHDGLSDLHVVDNMHERKMLMSKLSDGFVAMPGGAGTLEEFVEAFTWAELKFHDKPCALLNVDGYYDRLLAHLRFAHQEGFLREGHYELLQVSADPAELMRLFETYEPPKKSKIDA